MGITYYPPPASGGGGASDHGELSGLGDDDHTQYLLVGGGRSMSGALNMGTNQINNLVDPSLAQDAATRAYVDSQIVTDHGNLTGLGDDDHTQYLLVDGSRAMGGSLDMGTANKIVNLADPTLNQDAATKAYVDSEISGVSTVSDHGNLTGLGDDDHTQYLLVSGARAMSGSLDMGTSNKIVNLADPTLDQDAATKAYVDSEVSSVTVVTDHGELTGLSDDDHTQYLLVSGTRAMSGSLDMGTSNKIVNLADPTVDQDAATKAYVDSEINSLNIITDHGGLNGLADDDHPQYLLGNGTRAMTGALDMGTSHKIINLANPTLAQDAATKAYVDSEIGSISFDHGELLGLSDDDHTQYLLVNGTRALTGDLSLGGFKLTSVGDPTDSQDAATKSYVDTFHDNLLTTGSLSEDDQFLVVDSPSGTSTRKRFTFQNLRRRLLSIPNTPVSSNYTATIGELQPVSLSSVSSDIVVTFPSSPIHGEEFGFFIQAQNATGGSSSFSQRPFFCVEPADGTNINGFSYSAKSGDGGHEWSLWLDGEVLVFRYTGWEWMVVTDGRTPHFAAYNIDQNQTIANQTATAINGDVAVYDNAGLHNPSVSNQLMYIKRSNAYGLAAYLFWTGNSTGIRACEFKKGGTTPIFGDTRLASGDGENVSISGYDQLIGADSLRMDVFQNSGGNLDVTGGRCYSRIHEQL